MKRSTFWIVGALAAVGGLGAVAVYRLRRKPFGALLGSPIEGSGMPKVTPHGNFGAHRDGPPVHLHQGVDLIARPGSPVLAVGDGEIVAAEAGLGKTVRKLRLDLPGAWRPGRRPVDLVVYADLGKPLVDVGDRVRKGDAIALVWSQGFVHFAVKERRANGEVFFDAQQAGFDYQLSRPAVA